MLLRMIASARGGHSRAPLDREARDSGELEQVLLAQGEQRAFAPEIGRVLFLIELR